jgi:hypothetical protein
MRKPSLPTVIASLALFVALGGPARAAKLISGAKLKPNSVTSSKIRNKTLTSADISSATLASLKRRSDTVTSATIADGSIALADMSAGSVTGNQVVDRSLSAIDLATDTITGAELANGAIGNTELASKSVQTDNVNDQAITKLKVHSAAVGTSEVLDGDLTARDVGTASGKITATFTAVAPATCATQDFTAPTYPIPAGKLEGAMVLVGSPADNVIVTARPTDASTLRIQVCNPTAVPQSASGDFPYVAIAP